MPRPDSLNAWTTAPERYFQDHAVNITSTAAEEMRELFLRLGYSALQSPKPGSLLFPPVKSDFPAEIAQTTDAHRNRYVEVGIVTRGEMTMWWEGTTVNCPTGTIFVIPPGTRYMPHVQKAGRAPISHAVIWLAVHKSYGVAHMCAIEGSRHLLSGYFLFANSMLTSQARIVVQELADRSPHFETAVRGSLLCLLTWLIRAPAQPLSQLTPPVPEEKIPDEDEFSERVKAYFRSHYHRPLTLAQLARAVGCSPAYLCRRFRELNGTTPFNYLREVRIEAAKRLLISEVPIARIAVMVGFDDALYFSKVFAKSVGEPPQKFRSRNAPKNAPRSG